MTLLTMKQQELLVNQGLAIKKVNGNLATFKYHRKVMYDYLWKQHPELMECRGHTYDRTTGELVLAAPRKTFNYLEDERVDSNGVKTGGYWSDVPLDTIVRVYKKWNGFMATMRIYKGNIIVGTTGTTGTTNSNYARWAREYILKEYPNCADWVKEGENSTCTYLFEICHPEDPHIVDERSGAHYLGGRYNDTGVYHPTGGYQGSMTLAEALKLAETYKGEGFMLYTKDGRCCKLKSPYYVGKKKLMRMREKVVVDMFTNRQKVIDGLPEVWYPVVLRIVNTFNPSGWINTDEQYRRAFLESAWDYIYN